MSQIQGMFPGGPRHPGDTSEPRGILRPGEDVEAGITDRAIDAKAHRKRRSMLIAVGAFAILAVAGGIYMGIQAQPTPEQIMEEQRTEGGADELDDLARKVVGELWRMEEIEAARNRR